MTKEEAREELGEKSFKVQTTIRSFMTIFRRSLLHAVSYGDQLGTPRRPQPKQAETAGCKMKKRKLAEKLTARMYTRTGEWSDQKKCAVIVHAYLWTEVSGD